MTTPIPKIDKRTAAEIAGNVQKMIKVHAPAWKEIDPVTGKATGVSGALIGVFARFAEIIIQRLNQTPEKNFLAFLDLLGNSPLPPQPARVPLTFSLAAGSVVDGVVPAGTQVAAPPAEGEKEPVIFETERELTVTAAQLTSVFARDPEQDLQSDLSSLIVSADASGKVVFRGDHPIEHILYLGHNQVLGFERIARLRLDFQLQGAMQDPRSLAWEVWDGAKWAPLSMQPAPDVPDTDTTDGLKQSGTVWLGSVDQAPVTEVSGTSSRWLRGRLLTPITPLDEPRSGMARASQLPTIKSVTLVVELKREFSSTPQNDQSLLPELAFANSALIDLGKDFHPFGEKPKVNDTFYLVNAEAFSKDSFNEKLSSVGATIKLHTTVANPHWADAASGSACPSSDLELAWECWNGASWEKLGTSAAPPWLTLLELTDLTPSVEGMLAQGLALRGAKVSQEIKINLDGILSIFLSPLAVGEDGRFARLVGLSNGLNVYSFVAEFKTTTQRAWAVHYQEAAETKRPKIELNLGLPSEVSTPSATARIKVIGDDAQKVQKLRFTVGRQIGGRFPIVEGADGQVIQIPLAEGRNEILVEALNAAGTALIATTETVGRTATRESNQAFFDGTYAFTQSGVVTLKLPKRVAQATVNGQENYWLRVRVTRGDYGRESKYKLKNPLKPEDGFTLLLESFRPPLVSSVRIGYEHTLSGVAETILTNNNSNYDVVKKAEEPPPATFAPFRAIADSRPTLYFGFTAPPNLSSFPNRAVSLYIRAADLIYGERETPIAPGRSKLSATPGSTVAHKFTVVNTGAAPARFVVALLGAGQNAPVWATSAAPQIFVLDGAETQEVTVTVQIPTNVTTSDSDHSFMWLTTSAEPDVVYTADVITTLDAGLESRARLQLVWEYWNGRAWTKLIVRDGTDAFTESGLIEFLAPSDIASSREFGKESYWLRARWESGDYLLRPRSRRFLLNTIMAAQTVTLHDETLGSSDGAANQTFRATRAPILNGQHLEARETEAPSAEELTKITAEEGDDAITELRDAIGSLRGVWVRWSEVTDFYASGPRDRHYMIDHQTGEIRFGDGLNGLIPPIGVGNLRLTQYQTGGGKIGNKPAGSIIQLKTTVPYVDKVTNHEPASGGADAETLELLLERAPRAIRHSDRAVTREDFEDLAKLASPGVARARCEPLFDLSADPLTQQQKAGVVSVIIVPRSTDAKPTPSVELINRVRDFLDARRLPNADLFVVGPYYIRVDVTTEIALTSIEDAGEVESAVQNELARFLHPLTGGLDGKGWDFGRAPHKSDLYALLEAIPGVDHVRSLQVQPPLDSPEINQNRRFLVYSGAHTITLSEPVDE